VLDEAFIDFVEEASLKAHLARFPRLIILRSFTKFFGIPGLRLGYAGSPGDGGAPGRCRSPGR
jgi:threonine-phosphate decarboxylase